MKKSKKAALAMVIVFAIAVLGVCAFLYFQSCLQVINVYGAERLQQDQILDIAGLHKGKSILFVREAEVKNRINSDYRLSFEAMVKRYPCAIDLYVYERAPRAYFQYNGMEYTIDKDGVVLSASSVLQQQPGLILLSGLSVKYAREGEVLCLNTQRQQTAVVSLLTYLYDLAYLNYVGQASLSDLDNIYLTLTDSSFVRLGNDTYIRAKILSLATMRMALAEMGKGPGELTVTNPERPTYLAFEE